MLLSFALFILALYGNYEVFGQEEISAELRETLPFCRIGEDQDGAGIYFLPFAAWKTGESATKDVAKGKDGYSLMIEEMRRVFSADKGRKNKGVTFIIECAGVETASFLAPGTTQVFKTIFGKNKEIAKVIANTFIINVDLPPALLELLEDSFAGDLRSGMQVFGTDREEWEPALLRVIPKNVLLQGYGGTNPIPEKCNREEMRQKAKPQSAGLLKSILG